MIGVDATGFVEGLGLLHDPFDGFEAGLGLDADGLAGDDVVEDEGFLEDGGLVGEGVFDLCGFAGEAGDEDLVVAGVGVDVGEDDEAVFGVVFALEEFAEDFGGAEELVIFVEGFDLVDDGGGDVFEGGLDLSGVSGELEVWGEEDILVGVIDDGVAHVPEGLGLAVDGGDEALEGSVAEVEFPTDGDDGGFGSGEGVGGEGEGAGADECGGEKGEGEETAHWGTSCHIYVLWGK